MLEQIEQWKKEKDDNFDVVNASSNYRRRLFGQMELLQ